MRKNFALAMVALLALTLALAAVGCGGKKAAEEQSTTTTTTTTMDSTSMTHDSTMADTAKK